MKKLKVYIAGPYSGGDVMRNISDALTQGEELLFYDYIPFIPHLSGFWHFKRPRPYNMWLEYDIEWLKSCDALLRIGGESPGADKEVEKAVQLNIPVFYDLAGLSQWRIEECETS